MTRYELMYLVPTKYAEDELGAVIGTVRNLVVKHGGRITFEDSLGKKRLHYPIKHVNQCYYLISHFDAEPSAVRALDAELRLHNDVVRHLMVKRSEVTRKAAPTPAAPTAAATEETKREAVAQAKLEDLDRKLDELLTKDTI